MMRGVIFTELHNLMQKVRGFVSPPAPVHQIAEALPPQESPLKSGMI